VKTSENTTDRAPRLRRSASFLAALLTLALPLLVLGSASPADAAAYCGSTSLSKPHPDGVAKVNVTINRYCAGATYVTIKLSDTKCDGRSAKVELGNVGTWTNSNGCGTTKTWSFGANSSHGMPNSGTIKVCLWAANSLTWSSVSCTNMTVPRL
jgi:hypothetical protein